MLNDAEFNLARQLLVEYTDKHQLFLEGRVEDSIVMASRLDNVRELVMSECAEKLGVHLIRNGEMVMEQRSHEQSIRWRISAWAFRADKLCELVVEAYNAGRRSTEVKL